MAPINIQVAAMDKCLSICFVFYFPLKCEQIEVIRSKTEGTVKKKYCANLKK